LVRAIVRHGGKDPFEEARNDLRTDLRIEITAKQVQRITERIGREWADQRDREVALYKLGHLPRLHAQPPRVAVSMLDGGRAQTRASDAEPGVHDPQWREPKYGSCLTMDTQESRQDPQPEPPAAYLDHDRVGKLVNEVQARGAAVSARSRKGANETPQKRGRRPRPRRESRYLVRTTVATMQSSDRCGELLAAEAYRRGFDLAQRKGFVADGQPYNWTIWSNEFQRWGFVPILDFLHLLTYIHPAAHAAGGTHRQQWGRYEQWLRWAWGGERDNLLNALHEASSRVGPPPRKAAESDPRQVLASAHTYVLNNMDKMDYPRYRKLGLPTSSAPVESLVKQFNKRVKGTEKFWTEDGIESVLQVRSAYLSQDDRAERQWNLPRPSYRSVGSNRLALVG
jgi:hypothetical protein